jgi:hypothetical protein
MPLLHCDFNNNNNSIVYYLYGESTLQGQSEKQHSVDTIIYIRDKQKHKDNHSASNMMMIMLLLLLLIIISTELNISAKRCQMQPKRTKKDVIQKLT